MKSQALTADKTLSDWEAVFIAKAAELYPTALDASHDILHIRRVVATVKKLAAEEEADLNIVIPAAYLHDFVNLPKSDPRRKQASRLSADAARAYLEGLCYPAEYLDGIAHAIAAHSFSAGIPPETIEAKVVQDADRLDALGAIGIARCFSTNAKMGTAYYNGEDFLAENRAADDGLYAIDHFYVKLLKLPELMHTNSGKAEALRRVGFMQRFIVQMQGEISLIDSALI